MADKARYFAFLVYEDSAPDNWQETLKKTHGCYAISPLHAGDDEHAKPHFHVVYMHGNTVTLSAAKSAIPDDIPANGHVEMIRQPRNYQRYLIHLDDPEKEQFEGGKNDITVLNGFPLDLSRDYSKAELLQFRTAIFQIIRECNVIEYCELIDYLLDTGEPDLLDYASNHTILFNTYISSRRNSELRGAE